MTCRRLFPVIVLAMNLFSAAPAADTDPARNILTWDIFARLPDELGVAGPFTGVSGSERTVLLVAGGANFPRPVWDSTKIWRDRIHVLTEESGRRIWSDGGTLPRPTAYGMTVSLPDGILCMGGCDAQRVFRSVYLLRWNPAEQRTEIECLPSLPAPCAYGAAALIGQTVYVVGGQSGQTLDSAMNQLWALDLSRRKSPDFHWQILPSLPGPPRALHLAVRQHSGHGECLYVVSGRRENAGGVQFLKDTWEYNPAEGVWRRCADLPRSVMAGTGIGLGTNRIIVFGGADGSFFTQADVLKDRHPGFPKQALQYDTLRDLWQPAGSTPACPVTTTAVRWKDAVLIPSGEIRPRVRSPLIWRIRLRD